MGNDPTNLEDIASNYFRQLFDNKEDINVKQLQDQLLSNLPRAIFAKDNEMLPSKVTDDEI